MLREIRLYGKLGERFGRVHHLAVETVGEALRALMANYKDFEREFAQGSAAYKVWSGTGRLSGAEEIHNPSGSREIIRIAPAVAGSGGRGLGQLLLGIALIAAAVFLPASIAGIGLFGTATVGSVIGSIGISLALGGIAQMLSPAPKVSEPGEKPENQPSYVFNGAVNTTAQGQPVPICYGRLIVGSAVISAGITTQDIPV
jgi:predicted phage tail protein